jgi:hypothetical protein
MELRIEITKENKEKVFALISALLEEGDATVKPSFSMAKAQPRRDFLSVPDDIEGLENGSVMKYGTPEDMKLQLVGTWGQFNSFFPVKAGLRILANLLSESKKGSINLREFVFRCRDIFRKVKINNKKLSKYRGFPLRKKDSATGRFVWHFLIPAQEMGLIKITKSSLDYEGMPYSPNDWNKVYITITREGLEFARLKNPLFDGGDMEQILGKDEREWTINFLKEIDRKGFKEYTLLKDVFDFLKKGHNGKEQLWSWFENDSRFIEYVKSWSRKAKTPKELKKQIAGLARTFSASKIALLREVGIIRNKRGDYTLINELG